jgi:hypothetical protein
MSPIAKLNPGSISIGKQDAVQKPGWGRPVNERLLKMAVVLIMVGLAQDPRQTEGKQEFLRHRRKDGQTTPDNCLMKP